MEDEAAKPGHAITELPQGEQPGRRESRLRAEDDGLDWHLVRCAGRREHKAEAALVEAEIAVYLPRIVRWKRVGPDRERAEEALFGGYLFAGVREGVKTLGDIEKAEGVYRVVRFQPDRNPRPLAFGIIAAILGEELSGEFDRTRRDKRKDPPEGSAVDLIGGKFQGFPAKFIARRDDERIDLLFKMLGKWSPLVEQPHNVGGLDQAA